MLKYKIKTKDILSDNEITLDINNIIYDKKNNKAKIFTLLDYKLYNGQSVTLTYNNQNINYTESYIISNVLNNTFEIDYNPRYELQINNISKEKIAYKFIDDEIIYNDVLKINFENNHFYESLHDNIYNAKYISENLGNISQRQCINDNIIYNGFLYNIKKITKNKKYDLENEGFLNIRNATLYFIFNDREIILTNCIVLLDEDGNDITNSLIIFYDDNNKINLKYILNNYYNANIYCDDVRFFDSCFKPITDDNDIFTYITTDESKSLLIVDNEKIDTIEKEYLETSLQLKEDSVGNVCTKITTVDNNIKLQIPLNTLFATDLYKEDNVNTIFNNIKKNSINEIIDYEKQIFTPVYIDSKSYQDNDIIYDRQLSNINSIEFNLHFRERKNELDTNGNILKEWTTYDEGYWNQINFNNKKEGSMINLNDSYSDILGNLNFDDDDVYFQKNSLKKSFIRLSFYDSRDISTQVLQFYTTIFFDTGKMYSKYIKNIHNPNIKPNGYYVSNDINDDEYRIDSKIIVSNKYNKDYSCEGFYLYLFPDVIGNDAIPLYMKVEFNHAKYGRTIPFLMPTYSKDWDENSDIKKRENHVISVNSSDFPIHYMKENYSGINMKRVLNDMYIKVYVKYDLKHNQYVWFLPRCKDDYNGLNNKIIFNLWEPRIKGVE